MTSVARCIADYLTDREVGTFAGTSGWSIAVAREPLKPDDCITIYETGGDGPDTDDRDELTTFQVRVRTFDYEAAVTKLREIRTILTTPTGPISMGDTTFDYIFATSGILPIAQDDTDRFVLVMNYRGALGQSFTYTWDSTAISFDSDTLTWDAT